MKIDYMKRDWKRVAIKNKTITKHGVPTFKAMERQLAKTIKHAH